LEQIECMAKPTTLLVSGASGHLGRRVIELLLASDSAPARNLVATTRTPDKLADLAARGVTVRAASFEDPASLPSAFRGVDRALVISTDAVDRPGRRLAQHRAAVSAAKAAGVSHLVYTSLTHAEPDSLVTIAPDHLETERAIIDSGLSYALLRNNMYTDYLLHGLPYAVRAGRLSNAFGDGAVSYVTREDCARAAAAALASAFEGRARFDITGPAAITQRELASIASDIAGRPVRYDAVDAATSMRQLVASGIPEGVAELLVSFERSGQAGQLSVVSPSVRELTGIAPMSVRQSLAESRAALIA
jgi:NAD(P)H dehydrogenase (quinone)